MMIDFQQSCPYCGHRNIRFVKESLVGKGYMLTKCGMFSCGKYFTMKFGKLEK